MYLKSFPILVYPILSEKSKYLWNQIERDFAGNLLTQKGYIKKQNKILVNEGLYFDNLKNIVAKAEKPDNMQLPGMYNAPYFNTSISYIPYLLPSLLQLFYCLFIVLLFVCYFVIRTNFSN